MPTVNDSLQSESIKHAHYLYRYQTYEVKRALSIIEESQKELNKLLLEKADVENWTTKRQEQLLTDIKTVQDEYQAKLNTLLDDDMKGLTTQEQKYNVTLIATNLKPYKKIIVSDRLIPPNVIYGMAKKSYLMLDDGTTLTPREFIKKITNNDSGQILQAVKQGMLTGKNGAEIKKGIMNTYGMQRNHTDAMVRTLTNHFSTEARKITGKSMPDIIKGYKWVSSLDSRTTEVCRFRDGRVWFYDEKDRAKTPLRLLPGEVSPPAHYRCRSTITYITRSYKEMGIDLKEAPEGTRSSLNGYVPSKTTYYEWLENQSAKIQKDVLGATRYDLWQAGEIKPYQFYSQDGRWLTLSELEKKI